MFKGNKLNVLRKSKLISFRKSLGTREVPALQRRQLPSSWHHPDDENVMSANYCQKKKRRRNKRDQPISTCFSPLRIFPFFCDRMVLYIYGHDEMHLVSSYTLSMLPSFTPFFWSSFELLSIHTSIVPLSLFHSLCFHFLFLRPQTRKNKKRERFLKPPALDEKVHFKWSWRNRIFNPRMWWRAAIFTKDGCAITLSPLSRYADLENSGDHMEEKAGQGDDLRQPFPVYNNHSTRECCVRDRPGTTLHASTVYFFSTVSTPSVCLKDR